MNASERMVKQLLSNVNLCQLQKVFTSWNPEEFGIIDRLTEEQKRFEIEHYGYYQPMVISKKSKRENKK
ncbi:hypothetical protein Calab_1506 [Caldithrix abyssi DSM 13497]|nr:hypothetical protein [Caldithrix abyssi]EHO40392.1 hypothetical protein Calab_0753 [Caldithrix abyssi DSM 13497]EHO41126.1 hypothetical protein Calab_1506 [Caldithrix abyssi DSM 13497]